MALDYGFLISKQEEEQMGPILVMKDNQCGLAGAMDVPAKGNSHPWIARKSYDWAEELGCHRVVSKSDNEPSSAALGIY